MILDEIEKLKLAKTRAEEEIRVKIINLKEELKTKDEERRLALSTADINEYQAKVDLLEEKVAYVKEQIRIQVN